MMEMKLVFANFDARIKHIKIDPKCDKTVIEMTGHMFDEKEQQQVKFEMKFKDVIAINFQINYFDNFMGAEGMGLYEIVDENSKKGFVSYIFENRKDVYQMNPHYTYNPDDPDEMLNSFDLLGTFENNYHDYHLFVQYVDAGCYMILAKKIKIKKRAS